MIARILHRRTAQAFKSNSNLKSIPSSRTFTSTCISTSALSSNFHIKSLKSPGDLNGTIETTTRHFSSSSIRLDSSTTASKACPSCSTTSSLETLVCPKCSHLLPLPSEMDLYSLMGLDWKRVEQGGWKVDVKELKSKWRRMMGVSHPDRMGGKNEKEQQIAEQQSSLINRAYETLLNPLQRAIYLLELHSAESVSESDSLEDPELLMQVMEFRERLEECETEEQAQAVRDENGEYLNATLENLSKAFGSSPPSLSDARKYTIELRYWYNIDKAAKEWESGKRVEISH